MLITKGANFPQPKQNPLNQSCSLCAYLHKTAWHSSKTFCHSRYLKFCQLQIKLCQTTNETCHNIPMYVSEPTAGKKCDKIFAYSAL